MGRASTKPYSSRSDSEKIQANWRKISGHLERGDWSAAILRAATAIEIAANLAIRHELLTVKHLSPDFVNSLLLWANGIRGKMDEILMPYLKSEAPPRHIDLKPMAKKANEINKIRNSIAHSGQFKREKTAREVVDSSRQIILALIGPSGSKIKLEDV